jgi:hypothetical protein
VQRRIAGGEDSRGQRDRRRRRRRRAYRDDYPAYRDRAGQRPHREQRSAGCVLVHPQRGDQDQAYDQRNYRDWVQKPVGQQLRGAPERGHRAGRGQADGESVTRRGRVGRRSVLEGQQRHQQARRGDPGHDPEQRPPGVERRLGAAHQRAGRYRSEDAQVEDHRGPAQLADRKAEEQGRRGGDQQHAGEQALQDVPGDEHAGSGRGGGQHRAEQQRTAVHEQQPALREELGELHGQYRAHRIAGIGQTQGQPDGLHAHV